MPEGQKMSVESDSGWRTSTYSAASNCVEVAFIDGRVAVRDSKDRQGQVLTFALPEWQAFLAGARDGEFEVPQPCSTEPSALARLNLLDALRAGSMPVALIAGAGTGSEWFLVAALFYYRPVHDFLATILEALADRWARRIRPS
jgi:hypothetical protein